jgi:DNA-directed RNA polymerase specialized sigma24 family protein
MVNFLRSPYAILSVLVLALAAQVPHATDVFWNMGASKYWYNGVFALGFAIALEVAVLVFVMHGCTIESCAFALVSVAMNLCYYALHGMHLFSWSAFPAWLVSIALPSAIARYSHLAAQSFDGAQPVHVAWPAVLSTLHSWLPSTKSIDVQPNEVCIVIDAVQPMHTPPAHTNGDSVQIEMDGTIDDKARALQLKSEGLTNAQIAAELNVHRNTVGKWLNGHVQKVTS